MFLIIVGAVVNLLIFLEEAMFLIIVGAMINLLIFFFERWWTNNHPVAPDNVMKERFLAEVNSKLRVKLLPTAKRLKMASALFDKYSARYHSDPPIYQLADRPLSNDEAKG